MKTLPSLKTPTTVLALAAAALALAVTALILAALTLQGSAATAPAPAPAAAACSPIRTAPDEAGTRADSMANAVAALRLANPDREIEVLDLTRKVDADVRVQSRERAGAYYGDRPATVLSVPGDGTGTLFLVAAISDHLPPCERPSRFFSATSE